MVYSASKNNNIMGTDALFEENTIKEIQEIEKKLRNDIERKKEELRQMVGERYRDLMEAADTITEMREIAKSVTSHIKAMEKHCTALQRHNVSSGILNTVKLKVAEKRKKSEMLYSIASLTKILMDTPAKIYMSIESKDYLSGMLHYFLARHIHSLFLLEPVFQSHKVFQHFPIINRQWAAVNAFQHILLQSCHTVLEDKDVDAKDVVEPLCCIAFLSDSSPKDVLHKVLETRRVALQSIFKPEKYGSAAKLQVCEIVSLIQNTLSIVDMVFYPLSETADGCEHDLFLSTLQRITSKSHPGPASMLDLKTNSSFKYLPEVITDFRPILNASSDAVEITHLQKFCQEWKLLVNDDIRPGFKELLGYVGSVKGLALIREAVLESSSRVKNWDKICQHLLGCQFDIWDSCLRPSFLERIKDIIHTKVESASNSFWEETKASLNNICNDDSDSSSLDLERNVSSYIWTESSSDFPTNLSWVPHQQRHLCEGSTLGMKAYGLTPKIQDICRNLDSKLQDLLKDIAYFTFEINNENVPSNASTFFQLSSVPSKDTRISPDTSAIYNHLAEVTKTCFSKVAMSIETELSSLSSVHESAHKGISLKAIFLGHICNGIIRLCPHLKHCLLSGHLHESCDPASIALPQVIGHLHVAKNEQVWEDFKVQLLKLSDSSFKLWSIEEINLKVRSFESGVETCSASGFLKTLVQWDKVEIQEESEEGSSVKSILHIPQHVSVPLYDLLFDFCCILNKIGGHALSNHVKIAIQEELLCQLLTLYKNKMNIKSPGEEHTSHFTQTVSLQMLFDVQFLFELMGSKENAGSIVYTTYENIVSEITSRIDPFDLDVFSVPLKTNLKRMVQKSVVLLGLLASPDQIFHSSSTKLNLTSPHMDHNLMIATNVSGRFPLLPVTNRSKTSLVTSVPESLQGSAVKGKASPLKSSSSHSSSPNLHASENSGGVLKSASFYDRVTAMSSSWFGGT